MRLTSEQKQYILDRLEWELDNFSGDEEELLTCLTDAANNTYEMLFEQTWDED